MGTKKPGTQPHEPYRPSKGTTVYLDQVCPECWHKRKNHTRNGCTDCSTCTRDYNRAK